MHGNARFALNETNQRIRHSYAALHRLYPYGLVWVSGAQVDSTVTIDFRLELASLHARIRDRQGLKCSPV